MSLNRFLYIPSVKPTAHVPITLDKYQTNAISLFNAGYNLFITGSAGSGKSFIIRRCIHEYHSTHSDQGLSVTSTTGISALNIQGMTIHSWAGITPNTDFDDIDGFVDGIRHKYKKLNHWLYTKVLIIDEISMLDVNMFNFLHQAAMKLRRNSLPFGGIQLIIVGDFFQLPPIRDTPDTGFCFTSPHWNECIDYSIILKHTHRQKEAELITFLHKIRLGIKDPSVQTSLEHYHNNPNYNMNYTHLYPNKFNVAAHNLTKVFALPGNTIEHSARMIKKTGYDYPFPSDSVIEENLILKHNAFVIINKNIDSKKGLVNGRQGIFMGFSNQSAKVKTDDDIIHYIAKERWEFPNYAIEQYPLRLAWALTIHKSQGMGIEKLSVDIGSNIFDDGQVYVALSRATHSKYLHIKNYSISSIRVNRQVKTFYKRLIKSSREWYIRTDGGNNTYYQNKMNGMTRRTLCQSMICIEEENEDQDEDPDEDQDDVNADEHVNPPTTHSAHICNVCHIRPREELYKKYYHEQVCFECSIANEYYMELNRESVRKRLHISKKNIKHILSNCYYRQQSNHTNYSGGRYMSPTKLYLVGHVKDCL